MTFPERTLSQVELEALAIEIATGDAWRPLLTWSPTQRGYARVAGNDHVEVWVLGWMHEHDTGYHDHDVSSGGVAVVEGELVEERLRIGGDPIRTIFRGGDSFSFDHTHVHRMHNETHERAISIHAYSPVVARLGCYVIEPDGMLRRETQAWSDELRPLTPA